MGTNKVRIRWLSENSELTWTSGGPVSSISRHHAGIAEAGTLQKRWPLLRLLGQVQAPQRVRGGSRYHRLSSEAQVPYRPGVQQAMKDNKKENGEKKI